MGLMAILVSGLACEKKASLPLPEELQKQIALGETLFYKRDCVKCHGVEGKAEDVKAPKLSSLYVAEDTMLVKYQLSHMRATTMPPLELAREEISAITQYVATLHAKANTPSNLTNFDARCPVCGALLQKAAAIRSSLEATHNGKFYYFECPDCKKMFLTDPDWYSRTGYARAGLK
jgi:cytochrome c553/YHS domain-containing protein